MKIQKYVGLDVHKDKTTVAIAEGDRTGEVRAYGEISSDLVTTEKALRKIKGEQGVLHVAYEAGPTGFVLYRRLQQLGFECIVVAPSRTPQPKGGRQKTNRRDALQLARLHRAGELTGIHVPDAVDESLRDLTRARSDAARDLKRAKQQLKSFLLRQGFHYQGKANWSEAHQRYLRELTLPLPALKSVLEENLLAVTAATERVTRHEELIAAQVPQWRMYPAVQALMCFRGFQLVAAAMLVTELNDVRRFAHPTGSPGGALASRWKAEEKPGVSDRRAAVPGRIAPPTRPPSFYSPAKSSSARAAGSPALRHYPQRDASPPASVCPRACST